MARTVDHVVVGAGSAGAALAARLSEDPDTSVLLLEAGGGDRHPNVSIPAAFAKLFRSSRDWDHASGPEPGADDRMLYVPRGRMLGGSSSMNAMIYMRGRPADYDGWRDELGLAGWGWDDVLPLFRRAEDNSRGAGPAHGVGGPLRVEDRVYTNPLSEAFVDACVAAGVKRNDDFNDGDQDGAGLTQVTQRAGRRASVADGYLRPAMRRDNLLVRTGVQVLGIVVEGGRAVGVRARIGGQPKVVRPRGEVLVCAGAVNSPQLLMLSGIGPADQLAAHGIDVVADLPVGRNLQDHPFVALSWVDRSGRSINDAEALRHVGEYALRRRGKLASNVGEACAFVRSDDALAHPDLQFHFAPCHFQDHGAETYDGHSFTLGPVLVNPVARGHVELASADPTAKPRMVGNHLTAEQDLEAMVRGVEIGRRIAASGPLGEVAGDEIVPAPGEAPPHDRRAVEAFVRRRLELLYHPAGTCAMGADGTGVVDEQLRVHGVEGLRVVDASVFPTIPSGNTNAPVVMVAERAAELVRAAG